MKAAVRFSYGGKVYAQGDDVTTIDPEMLAKLEAKKLVTKKDVKPDPNITEPAKGVSANITEKVTKTSEKKDNPTGKK